MRALRVGACVHVSLHCHINRYIVGMHLLRGPALFGRTARARN